MMARYRTTVTTSWDPEEAFAYLAEFSNVAEWDPGVLHASSLDPDPLRAGARFAVVASFLGRGIALEYRTEEIERPRRVVLRAETGSIVSRDEMTFEPVPGGATAVTYDAELRPRGVLRLADPLLALAFRRIGDRARDGLAARLAEPAPAVAAVAR
jgi:hypothetical protein